MSPRHRVDQRILTGRLAERRQRFHDHRTLGRRHLHMIDAISRRRRAVTSRTSERPESDNETVTSRRFASSTSRRARPRRTRRSHRRVAVDGWIRNSCANSPTFRSRPSNTTRARNWGNVTAPSTAAIDRDATATSTRDDTSTASVTESRSPGRDGTRTIRVHYNYWITHTCRSNAAPFDRPAALAATGRGRGARTGEFPAPRWAHAR